MIDPAFIPPVPLSTKRQRSVAPGTTSFTASQRFGGPRTPRSTRLQTRNAVPTDSASSSMPSVVDYASDASENATVRQWFRTERTLSPTAQRAASSIFGDSVSVSLENCYNVGIVAGATLSEKMIDTLQWLLAETFDPNGLKSETSFSASTVIEVGPRLNFQTAWSSNAVTICNACGINVIDRLECSRRYELEARDGSNIDPALVEQFSSAVHDRMTETGYHSPLSSFDSGLRAEPSFSVDVLGEGSPALERISSDQGLGFDDEDIKYYVKLFSDMGRNPTNVELFDLAQSNSEHSRHWFFQGQIVIDGEKMPTHLLNVVRETLKANPRNSVVAFADNSSTIRGAVVPTLLPASPGQPSRMQMAEKDRDILFTAETHNFPSGVAPFPGAETGTGGRIRDTAATGVGSLVVAGTAGYAVGNLNIPGLDLPWEDKSFRYPGNLSSPLTILINASNGASDYGNKFGEPVVNGFARSYASRFENGERREFVKPIMFSGGMGQMDHSHAKKGKADIGLLVIKVGGPAYRIGMGGGAASSMMQGDNRSDLDFNAVQRGDAEMAQKVYRVLRSCVEMGDKNPVVSIHDQGAGGNCNVVKELIYPAGGQIDIRKVWIGDKSLSALEIWGAEYQEQFGLLLRPEDEELFKNLCARENVVPVVLGTVDGSGRIVLWDEEEGKAVVDMDLEAVLGDLPQKTFTDTRLPPVGKQLSFPSDMSIDSVLDRVLSLMSVGSKRFLTTKVDRSVTGLVAQQQCVGPLQLPLADAAVLAQSHFSLRGSATSIGERPSLTSLSPAAMARISVGEMMTNLAGVKITSREDVKCEGNWMWAAKLRGDCASLYDAAVAMRDVMITMGIAIDGGKDSLSMAAKCPTADGGDELVRAPGTLVITGYSTVENIELKLTPDLKAPGSSMLLHVDIAQGRRRMGGGSVAQVYRQIGTTPPDLDNPALLNAAFDTMQGLVGSASLLSYHDISDGGLLTSLLEMGFAGNCGMDITIDSSALAVDAVSALFAEELGMVLEVLSEDAKNVQSAFEAAGVPCSVVGETRLDTSVNIVDGGSTIFTDDVRDLRDKWEKTAFALERLQAKESCVDAEQEGLRSLVGPKYFAPWVPKATPAELYNSSNKPKVAIIREEGSNGDREMSSAFHMAGFEAWDISVRDISSGTVDLANFRGIAYVGGFSYADVLDSAKGWGGVVRFNDRVKGQFDAFYERSDTFSLGVCNGCQLMALLGRVPFSPNELEGTSQPRFIHNDSGRYESRFCTVSIEKESPAIMFKGMGGAQLGVWVAHGEGKAYFPDQAVLDEVERQSLAPLKYIDDEGRVSTSYPFNPNGSMNGIAGLCSSDGRHLALMPHPERAVLKWQWAYLPAEDASKWEVSPWMTMFQNAREWVESFAA